MKRTTSIALWVVFLLILLPVTVAQERGNRGNKGTRIGDASFNPGGSRAGLLPWEEVNPDANPIECHTNPDHGEGNSPFRDCVECCEQDITAEISSGAAALCKFLRGGKMCGVIAGAGGAAETFKVGTCIFHGCTGKGGDPGCINPPHCHEVQGGYCAFFCFSTSSVCGTGCPAEGDFFGQDTCCSPTPPAPSSE